MQRGTRAALAVALAGLLAAGTAGVTLAQGESDAPAAGSTHFFLLVPVTPPGASGADGSAAPNGALPDGSSASPGQDQSVDGAATPDSPAPQERSFILIPIPQGDAPALEDDEEGDSAMPGDGSDAAPNGDGDSGDGATRILVPQPLPHGLPPGILEA
jgi:hypothetical protein